MPADLLICRTLEEASRQFAPCAVSIGNFDGVHVGHRRLLRRTVELADGRGWTPSALTFHPHPARVVAPDHAPPLLTSPEQRCALMREEGVRQVAILPFTPEFSRLSPEAFVREVLMGALGAKVVLVGENFHFGSRQAGNALSLWELGRTYGFEVELMGAVALRGRVVSSSEVRRLIASGRVSTAARLLQRPHFVDGEVVRGQGIGAKLTVPTLNLSTSAEVLPARGVYLTRTQDPEHGRVWPSITNVGCRPTFGGERLAIETYLLARLENPSPAHIRVEFLRRLRDERKFENPAHLKAQILHDASRAEAYFRRVGRWVAPEFLERGKAAADDLPG